jgi:lipopolysaccharide biosynthesis regulator YciM
MDGFLFAILVIAIAAGFLLGRRRNSSRTPVARASVHQRYLDGLKHLLNEQPDAAIDTLVSELEVSQETAEVYFALGALWRRKGEMDRAIRVHQSLLTNINLTLEQMQQAQLELALDYTHSGLLDRGEVLLQELAESARPAIQQAAGRELVLLYQEEQEWEKAIAAADELCGKSTAQDKSFWRNLQAHYYCELAERALAAPDWNQPGLFSSGIATTPEAAQIAKGWLKQAQASVPAHPRTLLLRSLMDLADKDIDAARAAIASLRLEPGLAMVAVPLLMSINGYDRDEIWISLSALYQNSDDTGLIPFIAECLYRREGANEAMNFLVKELQRHEGLGSLVLLLKAAADSLQYESLRSVLHQALPFRFTCHQCGFHGRQFYWSCPSCKTWL